jgi:hypothetical protein
LFCCHNRVTHSLWSDEVKGTAASSSWLGIIQGKASKVYKFEERKVENMQHKGVVFDERVILLLVLAIHYNNLKSSDVSNVSDCVCL